MTILIGIKCKDGVLIGADSSATFSAGQIRTIEQNTKKIEIVGDSIIVAGTGQNGLGQRFCNVIKVNSGSFANMSPTDAATTMCTLARANFMATGVKENQYGSLVAFHSNNDIHLCEFAITDLQPELKTENIWYASMGSGQLIADPFLGLMRKVYWNDGMPSLQDGIFAAVWTLQQTIDLNPGGINGPIQLAVLKMENGSPKARLLTDAEIGEHEQNAVGVIEHLKQYKEKFAGRAGVTVPDIPTVPVIS